MSTSGVALQANGLESRGGGWYKLPDGRNVRGEERALQAMNGDLSTFTPSEMLTLSDLVGRMNLAQRAGIQYGGARDVYTVAGYVPEGSLRFPHYQARYERQDVAGRIVDMPPQATWRRPPIITDGDEQESTPFTEAFAALAKRLRLWNRIERVDRVSGIGRFGILVIGASDGDGDFKKPMEKLSGPESIMYLQAFPEGDVTIETWVEDANDPRYALPLMYEVKPSQVASGFHFRPQRVHHSRVIHVAEDATTDDVHGRPRLKRVFNRLMDLEKITAATGEAYWQLAARILVAQLDADAQASDDTRTALREAMQEVVHDLRRQVQLQGGKLSWLDGDSPDPTGAADLLMMLIAAGAGIPKRILFGTETGERASEQDERQWLGTIVERRERFAGPELVRPLIDRLVEFGGLPQPKDGTYSIGWPNLYVATNEEEADVSKTRAETVKALTPIGGDPSGLYTIDDRGVVHLRPT